MTCKNALKRTAVKKCQTRCAVRRTANKRANKKKKCTRTKRIRPVGAFIYFLRTYREKLANLGRMPKMPMTVVSRMAAKQWRLLDPAEKDYYKLMSRREFYQRLYEQEFRKSLAKRKKCRANEIPTYIV